MAAKEKWTRAASDVLGDPAYAERLADTIDSSRTKPPEAYGRSMPLEDAGTTHFSVWNGLVVLAVFGPLLTRFEGKEGLGRGRAGWITHHACPASWLSMRGSMPRSDSALS